MTSDMREKIDQSWANLQEALQGIPDERTTEPGVCGEWSVKDLLGHIAFWEDVDVDQVKARAQGTEIEPLDWREVNPKAAAERADWSLDKARQESEAAHMRLLTTLADHPDLAAEMWDADTWGHYDEHAAEIRAWREQRGI